MPAVRRLKNLQTIWTFDKKYCRVRVLHFDFFTAWECIIRAISQDSGDP
jgi:hypothetical protein